MNAWYAPTVLTLAVHALSTKLRGIGYISMINVIVALIPLEGMCSRRGEAY